MDPQFVWTCPQCGRSVPKRVSSCRCGHQSAGEQPTSVAPSVPPVPTPAAASRQRGSLPIVAGSVAATLAVVAVIALPAWWRRAPSEPPATRLTAEAVPVAPARAAAPLADTAPPPVPASVEVADPAPPSIEELVTQAMPAVVTVETAQGTGSGFFVSADTALTNKHVVREAEAVTLRSSTGGRRTARVVSSSWDYDLAVLKVDVANPAQPVLPLAYVGEVRVGEEVIAIGSPLGLQNTVTRGIVSAMRDLDGVGVVQTDAAINPGNSGGPLLDRQGRVVGVNTMKVSGRDLQSIGFAVSTYYVRRMLGSEFAGKSEHEAQQQRELTRYERTVTALASRADDVEPRWKAFRSSCVTDADVSVPREREWFALADRQPFALHDVGRCTSWREYFTESATRLRDGWRMAETRAAAGGVPVDITRSIRRKHRMFWADWDR